MHGHKHLYTWPPWGGRASRAAFGAALGLAKERFVSSVGAGWQQGQYGAGAAASGGRRVVTLLSGWELFHALPAVLASRVGVATRATP